MRTTGLKRSSRSQRFNRRDCFSVELMINKHDPAEISGTPIVCHVNEIKSSRDRKSL